jgi:uncharacterized SAM-binding protein YcdF (DUF218 family)
MLVLIKILTWMASPIGFMLWGGFLGLILLWSTRWKKSAKFLIGASIIQLAIFASPVVSNSLLGALEERARELEQNNQQAELILSGNKYAAIILLGGATAPANPPKRPYPDLGGAADRMWHAARLYRQGLAPKIIITGGRSPGLETRNDIQTEAQAMRLLLIDFGVPDSAMILEEGARNTRENASKTKALIGEQRVALVTSAFHMPRSIATFRKEGLLIDAFPTDFNVDPDVSALWDRILPTSKSLNASEVAIKEYIALLIGY